MFNENSANMDQRTFYMILLTNFHFAINLYADDSPRHYTDEWAVEIKGGIEQARKVASDYGFYLVDKVCNLHCVVKVGYLILMLVKHRQ